MSSPTPSPGGESAMPQAAVIGIVVVSLAIVGIIISFFAIRHTRRRHHNPLYPEGDTFLSHLPIDGPPLPPLPPMTTHTSYLHHNSNHHYPNDQLGGGEYDSMYPQGEYGDGHHGYYHLDPSQGLRYGHDGPYQDFPDQGHSFGDQQAHHGSDGQFDHLNQEHGHGPGNGGNGYQGFSDTGHHGGGDGQFQGLSDQGTTQGGGSQPQGANQLGGGTQDPGSSGFLDQGPLSTFLTTQHPTSAPGGGFQSGLPGQGFPSGQPGAPQQLGMSGTEGPLFPPPPGSAPPPLVGRPKINSKTRPRPESSTYSVLMPLSPTNTTHSTDLSHIDEAEDYLGYSPRSRQSHLDQMRYHDAISAQHPNPRVLSPKIAAIPSTQAYEARAPQLRDSQVVEAILSTGNVSPRDSLDRRHPQFHESDSARDSLFFSPSTNVRGPQDL
ncbi:hypothetical protein BGX34_003417 [Mortierella sp. NVP85]|nr:hypothetical protein BGX34_003417 [Mortierella sp. NVP85]